MLTAKEIEFAKQLLAYLDTNDLISLTKTTTNDVIVPTSRSDATAAILLHTETIDALLSRKKLTKEVLFKYLHDRQQSVSLSESKDKLRKRILQLLGISKKRTTVRFETDNYNCENRSDDSGAGSDISGSEDCDGRGGDSHHYGLELHNSNPLSDSTGVPNIVQDRGTSQDPTVTTDAVCHLSGDNRIAVQANFPITEFSQQFVTWFYKLLNAGGVGEEHFWADAAAEMLLLPGEQVSQGSAACGVSQLLDWVRNQLGLAFNPNVTSEGVRGRFDPHGLITIVACGTLHTPDRCVGIFTQKFALARDPFSNNNWKVKNTKGVLHCPGNALDQSTLVIPTLDSAASDIALLEPS
ncbi:uncharacterized protein LOC126272065 [Schistocerca gregaria]|uniref:uncharacterized protein LOC126272065 n=1 Tax=Schistocerca gregaria TaxID=7010 RepID=UPI00211E59AC|nr:uncharacterized protein LOC126272065 [Schistocerca gregaria]XP_049830573.1 uncharacterized protein LOC126272065 [Schistocerca gregaria]XP_049830582.1 uncharacterized protein LOC126272065 [Schistocerca gregaria]XP_049830592.1 uncharacterized protein LOC126272065 [Schistocerca gregaria]